MVIETIHKLTRQEEGGDDESADGEMRRFHLHQLARQLTPGITRPL
jgi:hypothetical protein